MRQLWHKENEGDGGTALCFGCQSHRCTPRCSKGKILLADGGDSQSEFLSSTWEDGGQKKGDQSTALEVPRCGEERWGGMLQDAAVFSEAVLITKSQLRDACALLRSWNLFLLGGHLRTSPGQDAERLVSIFYRWCC